MKTGRTAIVAVTVLAAGLSLGAFAELQNIEIGGSIWVRGRYFSNRHVPVQPGVAYPAFLLAVRAIGESGGRVSYGAAWDRDGNTLTYAERRTRPSR